MECYFLRGEVADTRKINSIAVLPFVNATADPNNEYLSDGLTESLISTLSQLPDLKVMARSTVFKFKGKEDDPRQIGQSLQVSAVLTGRITQHGDEIEHLMPISSTLPTAANSGARSMPARLADITQVQGDITRDISGQFANPPERHRAASRSWAALVPPTRKPTGCISKAANSGMGERPRV